MTLNKKHPSPANKDTRPAGRMLKMFQSFLIARLRRRPDDKMKRNTAATQ